MHLLRSSQADVIKCNKQLILLLRECSTSYTTTCLISDETHATLCDALTCLLIERHPLDGHRAVICADSAPGSLSLARNDRLKHLNVRFDVGHAKNLNKNPVAEKAVQELDSEFLHQMPRGGPVPITDLAVATALLNLCLRYHGLSAQELWTQCDQITGGQLPLSDYRMIPTQLQQHLYNHPYSERSKNVQSTISLHPKSMLAVLFI